MRHLTTALVLLLLSSLPAQAALILSTDFTGRAVSGSTASSITWGTNGVVDPGNLTASNNPDGLFDTAAAQGRFAPDRNLHNEGSWSVDILLSLLGDDIALSSVSLDAFIFNNDGDLQTVGRDLDLSLNLLDDTLNILDSTSSLNIYPGSGTISQPQPVNFDLSGNLLAAGSNYTLRLTAFGQGPGNNAGFDNLAVNGDLLPAAEVAEPAPLSLLLLGGLAMLAGLRQRRRRS